jgi:hypothetical protein
METLAAWTIIGPFRSIEHRRVVDPNAELELGLNILVEVL